MKLDRSLTSSVYVVYGDKVLLHRHKKYNTLFPLGGKINSHEVPHETAIREVYEESGLMVELYSGEDKLKLGRVIQLHNPIYTLLENIEHEVENIYFIYFAKASSDKFNPAKGESQDLYWFTENDIKKMMKLRYM